MRFIGVLVCGLLLTGCMPSQEQLRMQLDLEEMKRRLARIEVQSSEAASSGTASRAAKGSGRQPSIGSPEAGENARTPATSDGRSAASWMTSAAL